MQNYIYIVVIGPLIDSVKSFCGVIGGRVMMNLRFSFNSTDPQSVKKRKFCFFSECVYCCVFFFNIVRNPAVQFTGAFMSYKSYKFWIVPEVFEKIAAKL